MSYVISNMPVLGINFKDFSQNSDFKFNAAPDQLM
jgi:hypothetical protein